MTNKEKVKALFDEISAMNYGDTITHIRIAGIIDTPYGSNKYRTIVQKVKEMLLLNKKAVESVQKVGYRVVNPDDYTEKAYQNYQQGFRRIKAGNDVLTNAPVSEMSEEGVKVYRQVSDRARALYAVVAGSCVEIQNLKNKDHPLLHTARR